MNKEDIQEASKIYYGNHIKAQFEQLENIEFQFI